MMPELFARFLLNGEPLYQQAKQVAESQNYQIVLDDPINRTFHAHKKVSGKMIHLDVYVGGGKDRGITVAVRPGGEGTYMDYGRLFLDELRKVVR